MYKYSSKIPISPKSVVIVVGAFESVKLNARSLGHGADLFAANDEVFISSGLPLMISRFRIWQTLKCFMIHLESRSFIKRNGKRI